MGLFKNHLLVGIVYILAALGAIMGEMRGQHALVYACKPLMMLVLSLWFYFKSRRYGDRFTLLIQAGLFFSWLGDMALMLDHIDPYYFLIGLGAFMLAQLCYCIAFAHNVADVGGGQGLLVASLLMAVVLAYGGIFGYEVIPRVDADVQVPAGIYAFVTTLMGAMAALRFGRTYLPSFIMVFAGAVLFIASDSILATARFIRPLDHAPWSVLLLYAAAQYLIARGALRHVLDPEEARRRAALNT